MSGLTLSAEVARGRHQKPDLESHRVLGEKLSTLVRTTEPLPYSWIIIKLVK